MIKVKVERCNYATVPIGWWCRRARRHTGPCALERRWWNLLGKWAEGGRR